MKNFVTFSAGLLLLVLVGCQIPQTGSLKVSLQGLVQSRSVTAGSGLGDLIRLQLLRNNNIVSFAGSPYLEQGLAGQTVTLEGLAPGSGYSLAVVTGEKRASGFFEVGYYKSSDPFEISSGVDTELKIVVSRSGDRSPFTLLEAASAPHAVAAKPDASAVYYLSGTEVLDGAGTVVASTAALPSSTVLGLTYDSSMSRLWINTSTGIAVQSGTTFTAAEIVDQDGISVRPRVENSGYFRLYDAALKKANTISYYAGPGIVGGVKVNAETKWSTFESLMSSVSSTKDLLNGKLVRGFTATNRFLFLTTPIGMYRISADLIGQDAAKLGKNLTSGKDANDRTIVVDPADKSLVIGPVSAYSDATDTSDGTKAYVFGGTYRGLYGCAVAPVSGTPVASTTLPLVPGTSGLEITQVSTSPIANGDVVYTAAYSSTTRSLLIFQNLVLTRTIPAFAGLPTGTPQFSWYTVGTSPTKTLYLVAAGLDATVQYPVAQW